MARIYRRRPGGVWWTDLRYEGGGSRSTKTKDEKAAQIILADRLREGDDGRETGSMTLLAAENAYLDTRKNLNTKTRQADKLGLREFREVTAIHNLSAARPEHLRQYRNYLLTRGGKFGTAGHAQANKLFRAVLMFLNHCEDEEWIQPQRWKKVKKPFPDTKPRKFRYTPQETEKLLEAYGLGWIGTTLRLAYYCGLRRSEIFYLEWADVDFYREQLILQAKSHWRPKSYKDGDPPKVVPAARELLDHLKKIRRARKPRSAAHDRVIVGCPSLQAMTRNVTNSIRELKDQRTGLLLLRRGSLHTMRHTIIGHLLDAGEEPAHVQKFARHARLQQTMDYADVREEVARTVLKSIPVKDKAKN